MAQTQLGVHIHVAEDTSDGAAGGRLEPWVRASWRLAHCVHLDRALPGVIAHNPRSNLNNAVGYGRPDRFGNPVTLGTDGIGGDMLEEFRIAFALLRASDVTSSPETPWGWLEWDADATVEWSYTPVEPWHVGYTPAVRPVTVRVGERCVLDQGVPMLVDPVEIRVRAREQAARLHARL